MHIFIKQKAISKQAQLLCILFWRLDDVPAFRPLSTMTVISRDTDQPYRCGILLALSNPFPQIEPSTFIMDT